MYHLKDYEQCSTFWYLLLFSSVQVGQVRLAENYSRGMSDYVKDFQRLSKVSVFKIILRRSCLISSNASQLNYQNSQVLSVK